VSILLFLRPAANGRHDVRSDPGTAVRGEADPRGVSVRARTRVGGTPAGTKVRDSRIGQALRVRRARGVARAVSVCHVPRGIPSTVAPGTTIARTPSRQPYDRPILRRERAQQRSDWLCAGAQLGPCSRNAAGGGRVPETTRAKVRELILEHNALNVELYRFADRFERASAEAESGFRREMSAYRRLNGIYRRLHRSRLARAGRVAIRIA
jgi:hypothetical protein